MSFLKPFLTILRHPHNKGRAFEAIATVVWWKCNQLFFHLPAIAEVAPGVKIICDPHNSYGSFIVYAQWPEYSELSFTFNFLKASDTYIDVGAHIGDSSLLAASKITKGKILAYEPTPSIFKELVTNIKLNNFERRITAVEQAVSNKIGTAWFTLESASEVNHLKLQSKKGSKSKNIKVATTTLDTQIKKLSLKKVTLLKIDVEGFEWEVIQGAKKALRSHTIESVLFEVNPSVSSIAQKVSEIEAMLTKYDFEFYAFTEHGKVSPLSQLYVPGKTDNFLAVAKNSSVSKRLRKWRT